MTPEQFEQPKTPEGTDQSYEFVKVGNKLGKKVNEISLREINHLSISIRGMRDQMPINRIFLKTVSGKEYIVTQLKDAQHLLSVASPSQDNTGWVLVDPQKLVMHRISEETMEKAVLKNGESFGPLGADTIEHIVGVDTAHSYSPEELEELTSGNQDVHTMEDAEPTEKGEEKELTMAEALRLVGQHLSGTIDNIGGKRKI